MLEDGIRWVHDLEGHTTVAHTFVKTDKKSRASRGQPVKPCWLNEDSRGCFAEQSGFVDLGSLTKMKCIRTTMIPPPHAPHSHNLVGALESRWKEGSLEHEVLTGSANNPGPTSYNVTSFILTQTSFSGKM